MRKKKITLPSGKVMVIEVSEVELSLDDGMTVDAYREKKDKEKKFDADLDRLAEEIISKAPRTEMDGRTTVYWEIGQLVSLFIRKASDGEAAEKEPYMVHERAFARLIEKMEALKKGNREFLKKGFSVPSVPYLKKWERFARKFSKQQAERIVPYSLAHELIDDRLIPEDIDAFLDRCERGELKTNIEVREAVDKFLKEKGLKNPRLDPFEESSSSLDSH